MKILLLAPGQNYERDIIEQLPQPRFEEVIDEIQAIVAKIDAENIYNRVLNIPPRDRQKLLQWLEDDEEYYQHTQNQRRDRLSSTDSPTNSSDTLIPDAAPEDLSYESDETSYPSSLSSYGDTYGGRTPHNSPDSDDSLQSEEVSPVNSSRLRRALQDVIESMQQFNTEHPVRPQPRRSARQTVRPRSYSEGRPYHRRY